MANAVITPTIIAKEALMQLENNLVMGNAVHREYKKEFVKVGSTVNIRKPVKFSVTDGATLTKQDVEEGNTSIVVDQRKHVGWGFNTQDLTLSVEEYSERYIKPAMIALANQIDYDLCGLYDDVWAWRGTPGQDINSFSDLTKSTLYMDQHAVPRDMRKAVLSPADYWGVAGGATALYMQDVAKAAYRGAELGKMAGIDAITMDQNIVSHTVGAHAGTPVVNGSSQQTTYAASKTTNTQSFIIDGVTGAGTLKAGDVFTIADVYSVNPVSKQSTGVLQQFVITADAATVSSSLSVTLTISPAMILTGPYQNINAAPADNATITFLGTASTAYRQNLVFHRNAFALVTVPLEMPDGAAFKARESYNGLSIRVVKDYDIVNDEDIIRLDILYGKKTVYPELATRLSGTA